jgi:hypothetical protein
MYVARGFAGSAGFAPAGKRRRDRPSRITGRHWQCPAAWSKPSHRVERGCWNESNRVSHDVVAAGCGLAFGHPKNENVPDSKSRGRSSNSPPPKSALHYPNAAFRTCIWLQRAMAIASIFQSVRRMTGGGPLPLRQSSDWGSRPFEIQIPPLARCRRG